MLFTKMHGIGNDFIIVDGIRQGVNAGALDVPRLCDRHFGIGADGVILALPSDCADARMRIFNADGGEPEMCGNGIRCLAKYLYDEGLVRKTGMSIETGAGVLGITLELMKGQVARVAVDMGAPVFEPERIPVAGLSNIFTAQLDDRSLSFFCVSMGNPHAVTFDACPEDERFERWGRIMERHPNFPARANVEFCRINPDQSVTVRVWERGDGPTLACGTGACAVVAAGASRGLIPPQAVVHLPGGDLDISWGEDGHVTMVGGAERVFTGEMGLNGEWGMGNGE